MNHLINYKVLIKSLSVNIEKKRVCHLFPGIMIFFEIFPQHRYTGNLGIMISQFNDTILTYPWHIVKLRFHCITDNADIENAISAMGVLSFSFE